MAEQVLGGTEVEWAWQMRGRSGGWYGPEWCKDLSSSQVPLVTDHRSLDCLLSES